MATVTDNLLEFINIAEKNRKYPAGTASARRSAVRLFEIELNEHERESLDTLKNNIEQIYGSVINRNKSKISAESLLTYKKRFVTLIKDYENYGLNPTDMAKWNRPIRPQQAHQSKPPVSANAPINLGTDVLSPQSEISRFELPLRPGVKAIILVPSDVTKKEVSMIKKYVDFLESISISDESMEVNTSNEKIQ